MSGETLFDGAVPNDGEAIGGQNRGLGQIFQVSEAGRSIVEGAVYSFGGVVPSKYLIWDWGSSSLELDLDLGPLLPPTPTTGWRWFTLPVPYEVPEDTDTLVSHWTAAQAGDYRFFTGLTYPFPATGVLATSVAAYENGAAYTVKPSNTNFSGGGFGVDLKLDSPAAFRRPRIFTGPTRAAQQASRW